MLRTPNNLTGKKVFAFAGRKHHYERLGAIGYALRMAGADFRWVVTDNAINLDPAVEFLIPLQEKFVHNLDYLSDTEQVNGMTRDLLAGIYANMPADGIASFVPPYWLAYSAREACELAVSFRAMFAAEKPDAVIALHSNNFFAKCLLYMAQDMGIPTIVAQEGLLRHRDQSTQNKQFTAGEYVDQLLVWSDGARDAYIAAGIPGDRLTTVGIPHLDHWFRLRAMSQGWASFQAQYKHLMGFPHESPMVCFVLPQLARYDGDPSRAITTLATWAASVGIPLAIRFHPFEREAPEYFTGALAGHLGVKVATEGEGVPLVAASSVVVSQHTSLALEALALGIPLAEIDLDRAGVLESFADQGVAVPVGPGELDKIRDVLTGKCKVDETTLADWRKAHIGPDDGQAVVRVVAEIGRLIN